MKVQWSATAESDRFELIQYLFSVSPQAALDADDRIDHAIEILVLFPFAGRVGRMAGTRELLLGGTRYVAAYGVKGDVVTILRLFDAARDWPPRVSD